MISIYSCTSITEIRTYCGFRKKVIQEANRPCDVSRLQMAYLHDFCSKATKSHIFLSFQTEIRTYPDNSARNVVNEFETFLRLTNGNLRNVSNEFQAEHKALPGNSVFHIKCYVTIMAV